MSVTTDSETTELSARTSKRRIVECAKCHEPVASSAWSGLVTLTCGYCAFSEERELPIDGVVSDAAPGEGPYRTGPSARSASADAKPSTNTKLDLSLGALRPDHPLLSLDAARLRGLLARSPRDGEDPVAVEWERVWVAIWLAMQQAINGQQLRARISLETTLLVTVTPAYRALLLAHLAQHAAAYGAPALAKKWLRACPDVAVAEVASEIRAARALIDLARGRPEAAVEKTGGRRAGDGFVGNAVFLAIAVNIEGHERRGDGHFADAIVADLRKKKLLAAVLAPVRAFGLAGPPISRFTTRYRRNGAIRSAAFSAGTLVALGLWFHRAPAATLVAALFAGAACAGIDWVHDGMTFRSTWRRRIAWVGSALLSVVMTVLASAWLSSMPSTTPPRPPVPVAAPVVTERAPATAAPPGLVLAPSDPLDDRHAVSEALVLIKARAYLDEGAPADAIPLLELCVREHPDGQMCADLLVEAKASAP